MTVHSNLLIISSPPPAPPSQSRGVRAHADLPPTPPVPVRAASQTPQTPVRDTEAALLERYKSFCTNDPVIVFPSFHLADTF